MARSKGKDRPARDRPEGEGAAPPGAQPALVALVVVSGAVLMAFEILGSRMLAPFFGNSVFVWGSLIGVFLASLSLGYYWGGVLADRRPSFPLLSGISLAAAAGIFAAWAIAPSVCRSIVGSGLGSQVGPLVAATLIFFAPSVLMGMVSPFAIRLSARSLGSIGMQAGRLYALSTLGSIFGTLGTTFVLIPLLPVGTVLLVIGGALAVVPVFVLVTRRRGLAPTAGGVAAVALLGWWASGVEASPPKPGEKVIFDGSSAYHHVAVVDDSHGRRLMKFDDYYESGIQLQPPYRTVFPYTDLFHLGPLYAPAPRNVLFLGAGGGIGPRAFMASYPSIDRIDVVDVDPLVLDLAKRFFFLEESETVRLHADDARSFLRKPGPAYDVIVLDCFTIGGRIPFHLTTLEFFGELRARLAPGGVLVMNINSAVEGPKSEIYGALAATIEAAFGQVAAYPLYHPGERPGRARDEGSRNIALVAVAGGEVPTDATLLDRARASVVGGVDRMVGIRAPAVPKGRRLTDDHAPIETMAF